MNKLIIVEGPDGAGKTTLCNILAARYVVKEQTLFRTHHGSYDGQQHIWREFFDSILPAYREETDVLLDRSWLSEPIYGTAFRGGLNRIEHWQSRLFAYMLSCCNTSIIWCLPPVEVCEATFLERAGKEMLKSTKQLRQVHQLYELDASTYMSTVRWNVRSMVYDYTNPLALKEVFDHVEI